MSKKMVLEKQAQAAEILREKNVDMWLTFVRETSNIKDPMLDMIVGTGATWPSAFIISKNGDTAAIIGSLELGNMRAIGTFRNVLGYLKSIRENLLDILFKYDPQSIAINFSRNSSLADGLPYGLYLELLDHLKDTPFTERLISSEEIIAALRGRKSPTELQIMRDAIAETLKIFAEVTSYIKPGMKEKEVAYFIQRIVDEKGFKLAWDKEYCPSVFSGSDTAGAHAGPTERVIEKGHVINIDFGIKYRGYCSDLQRTWYVLRDGEDKPPKEVLRGFYVIKDTIRFAAKELRPGREGWEIDEIARGYITRNGYEEYPHGLGHQLGKVTHDGGAFLGPKWERYGNLPYLKIEEGNVFTLEPRLTIPGYGVATIEEEVVITKDGCEFLSPIQEEIYLIR